MQFLFLYGELSMSLDDMNQGDSTFKQIVISLFLILLVHVSD